MGGSEKYEAVERGIYEGVSSTESFVLDLESTTASERWRSEECN